MNFSWLVSSAAWKEFVVGSDGQVDVELLAVLFDMIADPKSNVPAPQVTDFIEKTPEFWDLDPELIRRVAKQYARFWDFDSLLMADKSYLLHGLSFEDLSIVAPSFGAAGAQAVIDFIQAATDSDVDELVVKALGMLTVRYATLMFRVTLYKYLVHHPHFVYSGEPTIIFFANTNFVSVNQDVFVDVCETLLSLSATQTHVLRNNDRLFSQLLRLIVWFWLPEKLFSNLVVWLHGLRCLPNACVGGCGEAMKAAVRGREFLYARVGELSSYPARTHTKIADEYVASVKFTRWRSPNSSLWSGFFDVVTNCTPSVFADMLPRLTPAGWTALAERSDVQRIHKDVLVEWLNNQTELSSTSAAVAIKMMASVGVDFVFSRVPLNVVSQVFPENIPSELQVLLTKEVVKACHRYGVQAALMAQSVVSSSTSPGSCLFDVLAAALDE